MGAFSTFTKTIAERGGQQSGFETHFTCTIRVRSVTTHKLLRLHSEDVKKNKMKLTCLLTLSVEM